jgi:hypothetical protein
MLLKKFFLTGMAVLLSVSFILTGCQPEADDDDGGGGPADKSGSAAIPNDNVTIGGDVVEWDTSAKDADSFANAKEGSAMFSVSGGTTDLKLPPGATLRAVVTTGELENEAAFNGATVGGNVVGVYASAADFGAMEFAEGEYYVYLRVTSENGNTVKWYKITVEVTALSDDATLKQVETVVKGVEVGVFNTTVDGTFVAPFTAEVTIGYAAAGDTDGDPATTFVPNHAGARVTKKVKVAESAAAGYPDTAFESDPAYNDEVITDGDVFIVKVTAENGTVKWSRITVEVTPASSVATLASATVKGYPVTGIGAEGTIESPTALTVTIGAGASGTTAFVPTDTANNAVARAVLVASDTALPANDAEFEAINEYTNGAIVDNDVFLIRVTAENGTKGWYKITVTVTTDITYVVTANGGAHASTTALTLAFNDAVTGLTAAEIAIGGDGAATVSAAPTAVVGTDNKTWTVPVTVTEAGAITVTITHTNVSDGGKVVVATAVDSTNPLIKVAVIAAADLAGAIDGKYDTALPADGSAVTPAAFVEVVTGSVLAEATVAVAGYEDGAGGSANVFDAGDTQAITIVLTAAAGYTFTGATITNAAVVEAVLDLAHVTVAVDSTAVVSGASGETLTASATYTKPLPPGSLVVRVEDGYDAILDIGVSTGFATVTSDDNGIVTFTPVSGYTGIKWYLFNGVGTTEAVSNTYDFSTDSIENRPYTLTVTAVKGGHLFSQTVTFTVGAESGEEPAEEPAE